MFRRTVWAVGLVIGCGMAFGVAPKRPLYGQDVPALPPVRAVPGLTAEDQYPRACVDCHVNYPDLNLDTRLSVEMARWGEEPDARVVEMARSVAASPLSGVHPDVESAFADVPRSCLACHRIGGNPVPLVPLLHKLHLSPGPESVFMSVFQGECTHCHKLDRDTGSWSVPSGPEN